MNNNSNNNMKVPFNDLKKQYYQIQDEIDSGIQEVIESTKFVNGKYVVEFEKEFSKYCNANHCVGLSNGTSAIEMTLKALGIKPGDEIITVPHTFIATAEAISNIGATPVFVDVFEDTGLMNYEKINVTPKTKAIIPVHLYGQACDMDPIIDLANKHNLLIVEDCAQAHGAEYKGKKVPVSGLGTFSFYPGKNLGAYGDAGAVVCNDPELATKIKKLIDHGRAKDSKYEHEIVGSNYRMDGIQGKVLTTKLKHLDDWTDLRRQHAATYKRLLNGIVDDIIVEKEYNKAVYHLFVIKNKNRDSLMTFLKENGVDSGIHYPIPLHLQPAYAHLGYRAGDFPITEKLSEKIISLPLYPEMSNDEIKYVCEKISDWKNNL